MVLVIIILQLKVLKLVETFLNIFFTEVFPFLLLLPFISSHLELPTLKQDVFIFLGRMFHHLYSYPKEGSVPPGHL